jgi:hypothetical protein
MDGLRPPIVRTALALAGVLACLTAPALAEQPPAGLVKSVAGSAVVVRAGQELPAAPGQPINESDTLRTGADGRLGVTLKDGTRLSLGNNTEMHVTAFAYSPAEKRMALALKVLRGVTSYISGRIAELSPGAVKIETPTSVIGIRGTHLLIGVDLP